MGHLAKSCWETLDAAAHMGAACNPLEKEGHDGESGHAKPLKDNSTGEGRWHFPLPPMTSRGNEKACKQGSLFVSKCL